MEKALSSNSLSEWMAHPAFLNAEALSLIQQVLVQYPFFQVGHVLQLAAKLQIGTATTEQDLHRAAIHALDRTLLKELVEGVRDWPVQDPISTAAVPLEEERSTRVVPESTEDGLLPTEEFPPVAEVLPENREQKQLEKELVEKFIKNDPKIRPVKDLLGEGAELVDLSVSVGKSLNSVGLATESFAKILEKQEKFSKSIEIYEKLILKNPEKKDYFAKKIKELSAKIRS